MPDQPPKTVIISGGTTGMGRAVALERLARGDHVTVIGSNRARGRALLDRAAGTNLRFLQADLSSIAEVERVVTDISERHQAIDALALFANRISAGYAGTPDGLEYTFALYYLSRHLLGHRLRPLLDAAPDPVIVNVAGVGNTAGKIFWDDPQLTRRYGQVRAQLQAGRANDLLGVAFAGQAGSKARYILYHPGFTRSGADAHPNPLVRNAIRLLARFFARPVADAIRPIVDWIDHPPAGALSAFDRGKPVDLSLKTLNPDDAARLAAYTQDLLRSRGHTS
ncbi:SDR family NAD(P)-dependent oxidoreductase [Spirillospora sp. NPDC029432]|uniref:SDR family NAD(P)-dependent oxidoreductase n=1 Tax=Spirillospora sp. NPDC029432 TaxID=3154599 RepID=UPI0034566BD1